MKTPARLLRQLLACCLISISGTTWAANLYWDTGTTTGLQAGAGAWSTTDTNWNTAVDGTGSRVAWTNGSDAVFSANGNSIVTIPASGVTVGNITFSGKGYRVAGTSLGLTGGACTITAGQYAILSAPLTGSGGITKAGAATLVLAGTSSYTGSTVVSAGELRLGFAPSEQWKADTLTGANGSAVSAWTGALSGLAAGPYGSTATPTLSTGALNGHQAVTFAGAQSLQVNAANSPVAGTADLTLAVVFRPSANGNNNSGNNWYSDTALLDSEQGGAQNDWGLSWSLNDKVGGGWGNPDRTVWSGNAVTLNVPHVAVYTVQAGALTVTLDGVASSPVTTAGTAVRNAALFAIGSGSAATRNFSGDIADIQVFNTALPAQAITNLSNALASTYGGTSAGTSAALTGGYLPATTTVTVASGATLNLNDNNLSVEAVSGAGAVTPGLGTLTQTGIPLYWNPGGGSGGLHAGNGVWSTSAANWNDQPDGSGNQVVWSNGYYAIFPTNGASVVTVSGAVTVKNMTFSGTGYRVIGGTLTMSDPTCEITTSQNAILAAPLAGGGSLIKSGAATLVLASPATYTGATTVTAGELRLGLSASEEWNADTLGATNGATVTTWAGAFASLSTATYGTAANPLLTTAALNGHNVVTFNGASGLQVPASVNPISGAGDFSVAVVFRPEANGNYNAGYSWYLVTGLLDAEQGGVTNDWGLSWSLNDKVGGGLGNPDHTLWSGNAAALNAPHIAVYTVQNGTQTITLDGISATPLTGGSTNARNTALFAIGCGTGPSRYFTGDIANIQVFNGALSSQAVQNLGQRLAGAYGSATSAWSAGPITGTAYLPTGTALTINSGATLNLNDNNLTVASIAGTGTVQQGFGTLTVGGDNSSTTLGVTLTGEGGLVKTGAGTLTVTAANTATGTTSVNQGTLALANGAALAGPVNVAAGTSLVASSGTGTVGPLTTASSSTVQLNGGTLQVQNAGATTLAGPINGTGNLFLAQGGTATLTGAIAAGIHTTLTNAALIVTDLGLIPGGITDNGTLTFTNAAAQTYAASLDGNGSLLISGAGAVTLTGSDPFVGVTTIATGSTLQLGNGTVNGLLAGDIVNNGALAVSTLASTTQSLSGNLTGPGTFIKTGTGSFTVNYLTYTGGVSISGSTTTLSTGGTVTSSLGAAPSGTLVLTANTTIAAGTGSTLLGYDTISIPAGVTLTINTNSQDLTLPANLTGAGSLAKINNGTLTLTGTNSYGSTTVSGGTLVLAGTSNTTGVITVNSGLLQINTGSLPATPATGTIKLNAPGALLSTGAYATVNAWLASGKIDPASTGAIALVATTSEPITLTGYNLTLGATGAVTYGGILTPNNNTWALGGGDGVLTIESTLSGTNSLKIAAGTVVLPVANTHSGGTTIAGGNVILGNPGAFGSGLLSVTTGSLDLNGQNLTKDLTLAAGNNSFTLQNTASGTATMSGAINGATNTGTLTVWAGQTSVLAITGKITASYVTTGFDGGKKGLVILNPVNGPNAFQRLTLGFGSVRANDGWGLPTLCRLVLAGGGLETSANLIRNLGTSDGQNVVSMSVNSNGAYAFSVSAVGGPVTVNLGAGATLDRAGNLGFGKFVLNDINADSPITFVNPINLNGNPLPVTVCANTATMTGAITNTSATAAGVSKFGAGTLVLAGANTYDGSTNVSNSPGNQYLNPALFANPSGATTLGTLIFQSASAIGGTGRSVSADPGTVVAAGYPIDNAFLQRLVSPNANAFTVALAANSSNNLDFSSITGAALESATLGAIGNATYGGVLTPYGTTYRLGGGGGTLTVGNPLIAANSLVVGGFSPVTDSASGHFASNGTVILPSGTSLSGGTTILNPGTLKIGTGTVPAAPTDVATRLLTSSSAKVTWLDHANNESGFEIDLSTNGGAFASIATVGPNVTSYQATGLATATSYQFQVRAYNGSTFSFPSNTASLSTQPAVLTSPSAITATGDYKWVDIEWADNASRHQGIVIQSAPSPAGPFTEITRVPATVSPLPIAPQGTQPRYYSAYVGTTGTTWFRLAAYDFDGNTGPWSNPVSATTDAAADVRADLRARFNLGADDLPAYSYSNPTYDYTFTDAQKQAQRDAMTAMVANLQNTVNDPNQSSFVIPAGDYRLSAPVITITRSNFTLKTSGPVNFYYEGSSGGSVFNLINCDHFTLQGPFFLDAEVLTYFEGQVVAYDSNNRTVDLDIPDGYPLPASLPSYTTVRLFSPKGVMRGNYGYGSLTSQGGRRVRLGGISSSIFATMQPGDIAANPLYRKYSVYANSGCSNMTYQDITDYTGNGYASFGLLSPADGGDTSYINLRFMPKPGTNRLFGEAPANQSYFGGTWTMKGCAFYNAGDDGVSVSTGQGVLAQQLGPRTLILGGRLAGSYVKLNAPLGFYTWGDYQPAGNAIITSVTPYTDTTLNDAASAWMQSHGGNWPSDGLFKVTVDRDVCLPPYAQFFNLAQGNDRLIVRNCYWKDMTGPVIQWKAARQAEVADNLIVLASGQHDAIQSAGDETFWQEGKWSTNVLIRNNVLHDNLVSGRGNPIRATMQRDYPEAPGYLTIDGNTIIESAATGIIVNGGYGMGNARDISIVRNRFVNPGGPSIVVSGIADALIQDNVIAYGSAGTPDDLDLGANVDLPSVQIGNNQVGLALTPYANTTGLTTDSVTFTGGLGGTGLSYSAALLGGTLTINNQTFTLGATGSPNTVQASGQTIGLKPGNYSDLNLLATSTSGNQPNQTFTVTYTDGTTASFTRSISSWTTPQSYAGETIAQTMAYRNQANGTTLTGTNYVYSYDLPLDPTKTTAYLTLPNNPAISVLALALRLNLNAPSAFTASAVSTTQVTLAWTSPVGAITSLTLDQSTDAGFSDNLTTVSLAANATGYSFTALSPSTHYYYRLRALTAAGSSGEVYADTSTPSPATGGTSLPGLWQGTDVGQVGVTGATSYANGTYTLQGAGTDIGDTTDAFQFSYQTMSGDGTIVARVASLTNGKAGVMIRESLAADAKGSWLLLQQTGTATTTLAGYRSATGTIAGSAGSAGGTPAPYWLKLVRAGNVFTAYNSPDGVTWTQVGAPVTLSTMAATTYVGVVECGQSTSTLGTGTFDHVSVVSLPSPWVSSDVGAVNASGSAKLIGTTYTVTGSGTDIWNSADGFRYAYQTATGDCDITARVTGVTNTNIWAKAGVMIRETLDAGSRHATMAVAATAGKLFEYRATTNGAAASTNTSGSAPSWVRIVRSGDTFTGYTSADGVTWTLVGSATIPMATSVYIGLAVTSHNNGALCTAPLDNVTVNP